MLPAEDKHLAVAVQVQLARAEQVILVAGQVRPPAEQLVRLAHRRGEPDSKPLFACADVRLAVPVAVRQRRPPPPGEVTDELPRSGPAADSTGLPPEPADLDSSTGTRADGPGQPATHRSGQSACDTYHKNDNSSCVPIRQGGIRGRRNPAFSSRSATMAGLPARVLSGTALRLTERALGGWVSFLPPAVCWGLPGCLDLGLRWLAFLVLGEAAQGS
jgi:hypothetical protein